MHTFPSWQSYSDFAHRMRRKERYVRSDEVHGFLAAVTATSKKRIRNLGEGTILWRAQLGFELELVEHRGEKLEMPMPYPPKRMIPLAHAPTAGRVNPVGIPVLYLATDAKTAVAEVRPWIGKHVSVAQFKLMRKVKVVDCASEHAEDFAFYDHEPDEPERERAVWQAINRSFSQPVATEDQEIDYVPTQLLAEHFRSLGAEGIAFKSLLGGGTTLALYDIAAADIINCTLHYVRRVSFEHDEVTNPYYVSKHYSDLTK